MRSIDRFFSDWLRLALYWGTIAFSVAMGIMLAAKLYVETAIWISAMFHYLKP